MSSLPPESVALVRSWKLHPSDEAALLQDLSIGRYTVYTEALAAAFVDPGALLSAARDTSALERMVANSNALRERLLRYLDEQKRQGLASN